MSHNSAIKRDHNFYGKINIFSVKSTLLLKSWFHDFFSFAWSRFEVIFHTVLCDHNFYGKINIFSVKSTFLLNSWFHEFFFFCVIAFCSKYVLFHICLHATPSSSLTFISYLLAWQNEFYNFNRSLFLILSTFALTFGFRLVCTNRGCILL